MHFHVLFSRFANDLPPGKTATFLERLRDCSRRWHVLHGILIAQLILMPCPPSAQAVWIEVDTDGDGNVDSGYDDGTPDPNAPEYIDPAHPYETSDSDGDGLMDYEETAAGTNLYNPDSDYDGLTDHDEIYLTGTNPLASDSNGNGISDYNEFYGNYTVDPNGGGPPESPYDHDGDGIADPVDPDPYSTSNDPDSDGDSIADSQDTDPYNTMVWCDYNRNGVNDDAESQSNDQDGDGVSNETDSHPYDPALSNDWNWNGVNDQDEDWDGDGVSNLQDSHPNSNTLWCDWNSNGVNDDAEAGSMDSDGDGHPDASDSHPYYSALWNDWNNNGTNDEADSPVTSTDSDADGHADNADSHPSNSALWEDWNNNGVNDSQESTTTDSDSDGIEDGSDSDPGNPSLWSDWNHNGVNEGDEPAVYDPTQQDGDADGHVDAMDSHPGSPGLWEDWNFNGLNDSTETYFLDSDGDGTSDAMDTHPSNPALWDDQNSNGVNDGDEVVIVDTDGDGYADPLDTHPGDAALYNDHDNNGTNDEFEAPPDDDADAIPDSQDPTPDDQDNDGVTDTEEYLGGTNPGEVDTDGDGLADGMEAYAGTDPLNVDTDGDGLTDFEELMAYHTDPLSATGTQTSGAAGGGEDPAPAPGEEHPPGEGDSGGTGGGSAAAPGQAEIDVRLVVDAVTQEGFDIRQGSLVSFPSTSGRADQSDLKKTFVIQNSGSAPLSGLQLQLTGADQAAFEVSVLASDTLSPGGSATFTLTFKAPAVSATRSLRASLLIASNDTDEPSYELQLFSVSGFWHAQRAYFFADLSDGDHDGIPDRVEDMYAPLVVTPDGDLDGDGVSNLTQYLSGLDIRGGGPAGDFDGDEISDAVEDSWSRHTPGALNKYRFRDAFQDPDGDGLLTLEEVNGWWGGRDDPAAVATHPFKNCTGPNNAGTAPSYNVAARTPPASTGTASDWFNRESELSAWMNDGLLRLACRERGSSMTVAAFFASRHRYKKPGSSASYGYDHLPAGYLAWLGLNAAAIPATTTVLPAPPADVAERIAQRKTLLRLSDPDLDGMPSEWEAVQKFPKENAFCLDWRNPSDASLPAARTFLQQQIAELTQRIQDLDTRIATAATTARLSLVNQRTLLEVERTARQQVLDSRLGTDGQSGAVASPHSAMMATGNVHQTLLMEPYLITAPKAPAALASPPAETATAAVKSAWELKRDAWVTAFTDRLQWEILSKIDPDHDGLVNADEYLLGLSPRLPDYTPTGGRDTDGDGFTDAQELTAGTNHLDRTQFPPFTLHVISGSPQVVKIHQELSQPLVLEARRADGTPQPGIALTVTTSRNNNLVLLSGSDAANDWWPKTLQTTTGTDGRATIRVKAPNTAGTLTVTASAAIKTTTKVTFSATVSTLIGDVDGDGMPDAWETQAAQNGQPAHALNKSSALDAATSPLDHAYHRDTPLPRLPASIQAQLLALRDSSGFLSDYSPSTSFATDRFTAAQRAILARVDPDHDGWSNLEEYQHGTHPRLADNPATALRDDDGDGLPNLWEHQFSLNFSDARDADLVLDPALTQAQRSELMNIKESGVVISYPETYADSWRLSQLQWEWMKRIDPDHDGWTNLEEYHNGSNPRVPDTTYLRVRRGSSQTAPAGQPLPEPVVVQAVREVVSGSGMRLGFTAMANEEMTFSGPEGMTFTSGDADSPPGINPLTLSTDETGYARVHLQAPAQTGKHTIFASLSNGRKVALSLEVQPPETGGGPGGGGPGTGAGSTQPNPEFTLQWQYVWRSAWVEGRDSAGGFSYHRSQQKAAAPGVQPTRVGAEASHPPLGSSSLHYGHNSENPAQDDPGLAYTESYLYDPGWKEFPSTDFGTTPSQDWHKSAPPLNAESVLMIPFESFSPMLCGNAHDDRAFGVSRSRSEKPSVAEDGSEGRTISASVEQHRARIVAVKDGQPVVLPQGTTLTLLAVETVTQLNAATGAGVATETRIRKTVQMVIPPGASSSTPIQTEDLMSPAAPNTEKLLRLIPVEVVVPDVQETNPPLLAGAGGGSPIADGGSPPAATSSNPPGSTPEPILFSLKPATELKVAKLEHSLNAQNQIEANKDHDCFYLRIPSFKIAGIPHEKGDIKIKISTKGATDAAEYNDPAGGWIDLEPILGSDTWITQAQLLVSDHGIDDLPTGLGADYVADEQANDRTHVVELGGTVVIERMKILTDEFPLNIELPVKKKKEVSVRAVCMADQDINVSGAQHYLKIANERLAQTGVKLKVESVTPMAVPTEHMSDSRIMAVIKPIGATKYTLGPNAKALIDTYKTQQFQGMTANDIVIFFCREVRYPNNNPLSGQCVRGLATFESYANASGAFENSGFDPPTPSYANKIFISDEHRGIFTTAHEIAHCLTDHGHYQVDYNPDNLAADHHKVNHNLMRRGTTPTEGIEGTKRLYKVQETLIFPTN